MEKYDYYILKMEGCVEPVLVGPITSETETQQRLESYQSDPAECQNSHIYFRVSKGSEVELW